MWTWLVANAEALGVVVNALLLLAAVAAALYARKQVSEAASLRREQAQPYVAADMRMSEVPMLIELFIKNYGTTAAKNVRVRADPPLSSKIHAENNGLVPLFDVLPTLAPGQEWCTLWDSATQRHDSGLNDGFDLTVSYESLDGTPHSHDYRLDWAAHWPRQYLDRKGLHNIAEDLHKLTRKLEAVVSGSALIVQSKQAKEEEAQAVRERHQARREQRGTPRPLEEG